jgi:hypothetical protein
MEPRVLDRLSDRIREGERGEAYDCVLAYLQKTRRQAGTKSWKSCAAVFREHPLHRLLCQSPLYRRAFEKPRGYAEDGILLDLLCGIEPLPAGVSPVGETFFRWQLRQVGSLSFRARAALVGRKIDAIAARPAGASVLAVASGHLAEVQYSRAASAGRLDRLIAVDHDPENLEFVERRLGRGRVETVQGTVRSLLSGRTKFNDLDLIYSPGLFHSLGDAAATSLARVLFGMLRPGGVFLLANFASNLPEIALLEAGMDWWLAYRDEGECERLTREIPACHPRRLFRDEHHNLVFVEVRKTC